MQVTVVGPLATVTLVAEEVEVDPQKGLIRIDDGTLRKATGGMTASVRLQKRLGRGMLWRSVKVQSFGPDKVGSVSAAWAKMRAYATHVAIKDGCPPDEAEKLHIEYVVSQFYDNNLELFCSHAETHNA